MYIRKTLFSALMLFLFLSSLTAQNTNSPYSRFGYGILENPALGKSRAMGGIGFGLRDKGMVNPLNPASYASVDTMNFVFDFGVSTSCSFFKENTLSQVNPNGRFDYIAMKVPLKKTWGLAFGLLPYSNVGYSYSSRLTTPFGDVNYTKSYEGRGGLNDLFVGTGFSLGKNLSLGVNFKYIYGMISYSGSVLYDNTDFNSFYPSENWYLGGTSLDFGAQYQLNLSKKSKAVLGASFTNASSFNINKVTHVEIVPTNKDTVTTTRNYDFGLPNTIGFGASYTYDNRLTVGFDYQGQAWSKTAFFNVKDTLSNSKRLAVGVEYLPKLIATNYFQAIKYRLGLQYGDSYLKFSEGSLKNVGLSLGFGLPLRGQKSVLNFAFEAGQLIVPNSTFIGEKYYKVSLDVAFNEFWFFKRKL